MNKSFDLDRASDVGMFKFIDPYLYVGWYKDHTGLQQHTRKIDVRTWTQTEIPPIPDYHYPITLRDQYIAYGINFTVCKCLSYLILQDSTSYLTLLMFHLSSGNISYSMQMDIEGTQRPNFQLIC